MSNEHELSLLSLWQSIGQVMEAIDAVSEASTALAMICIFEGFRKSPIRAPPSVNWACSDRGWLAQVPEIALPSSGIRASHPGNSVSGSNSIQLQGDKGHAGLPQLGGQAFVQEQPLEAR
jgi:hypothetical protein